VARAAFPWVNLYMRMREERRQIDAALFDIIQEHRLDVENVR